MAKRIDAVRQRAPYESRRARRALLPIASDVIAYRDELLARGIKAGPISYPSYMPEGEFRIDDPDGYCLLVGQSDEASL